MVLLAISAGIFALAWLLMALARWRQASILSKAAQDRQLFDHYGADLDSLSAAELQHYYQLQREHGFKERPRAFTFIELLVVLTIIGILVVAIIPVIKSCSDPPEREHNYKVEPESDDA